MISFDPPPLAPNRQMALDEAIRRFVRPGQSLYFAVGHTRPHAAMYEICRQFRGRDPQFSLAVLGASGAFVLPIHFGLVRRLITTFAGDTYPTPSPSPVIDRAWKRGMAIEAWSVLSYVERLRAAARGAAWTVTGSLAGSSMLAQHVAEDRARVLEDGTILLRGFAPDLAFVHAAIADGAGNVVMTPPHGDGIAGALAAREGVIVTVEKIVSTEEIRAHADLVRLPRSSVRAVCEAPFGAHPAGLWAPRLGLSYAEDYDFLVEVRRASRGDLDEFFERRIARGVEIPVEDLQRRAREPVTAPPIESGPATAMERAIVEAARIVRANIVASQHKTLLAGIGAANLAAWLAARSCDVDLMAELGLYGFSPQPREPFVFHFANLPSCLSLGEIDETLGLHLGRGMAVLGAAQIDAAGNVNTTELPGERYLLGSGGHNDCASLARDALVICGAARLVERVAYVTSPGTRITGLVTERGAFDKIDGRFRLRSAPAPVEDAVEFTRARGFEIAPEVEEWRAPDDEDLARLRAWDPRGDFRGDD